MLVCYIAAINYCYGASKTFDALSYSIDNEFDLPANYLKGNGDRFNYWQKIVNCAASSKQCTLTEISAAVTWMRR